MTRWIAIISTLSICLFFACNTSKKTTLFKIQENFRNEWGDVMIMAHRANLIDTLPENSLEGVLACIEHGIDIIEIDLQVTKDGVLIVMHDDRLDRMTNGYGNVNEKSWEEIQQLNLRYSSFGKISPYKVPSFEDVLYVSKNKILINVDKAFWYMHLVTDVADSVGIRNQIILKSYDSRESINKSIGHRDDIFFTPIFLERGNNNLENIHDFIYSNDSIYPEAVELIFESMDDSIASKDFIDDLHRKGIRPIVNSLSGGLCGGYGDGENATDNWLFLINHGFSIIQTDKGLELKHMLDSINGQP